MKHLHFWRAWLFFSVALAMAAGVTFLISLLWERVDECRRVQTDLAFLQADAYELDTLQGDAFSMEKLDKESVAHMEQIRARAHERVSRLGLLRPSPPNLGELTKKYQAYVLLVDQVFSLIDAGKIQEARQFDVTREDPAFDELKTALQESQNAYDKRAAHLLGLVRAGIFLMLLGGVGVIAGLVWQFNKKRHMVEIAAAEQRVLNRANVTLQAEVEEHKRSKKELQWKTAFLEAQVNSSIDGILVVDEHGRKLLQNQRLTDLFKIQREVADDKDERKQLQWIMGMVKNPELFAQKVADLYSHLDGISRDEIELKNGTVLDRYTAPVIGEDGKYYGRIWAYRDITEGKHLEARLFQSQKMEIVGRLAGGVAHEFNNILAGIILQIEFLRGDLPAGSPLAANAAEISTAANRAAALTRQLLAYGRRQILRPEILDLNRVIAGMEDMIRNLMGEHMSLHIIPAPDLHAVKADARQMEQVIMNMVINAHDAMPGGGRLTLETANVSFGPESADRHPDLKPGDYVVLAITDTGVGMSEEVKSHLFEPFFTTKDVGQGTGLGLSTCYGSIKQSGGHIGVFSEPGCGATFKIYLAQAKTSPDSSPKVTPDGQ